MCHLEATFGWRQAYLSQHLMALRKAGIVVTSRQGRNIHYRLSDPRYLAIIRQAAEVAGRHPPGAGAISRNVIALIAPGGMRLDIRLHSFYPHVVETMHRISPGSASMINKERWVEVDEQGRLVLPPEVAERFGIRPGTQLLLQEGSKDLNFARPVSQLARVYVEPTSRCNLTCRTCIRNAWDEPQGDMPSAIFDKLIASVKQLPFKPGIFFGGFGEPLLLPNIAEMVAAGRGSGGKSGTDHQWHPVDRKALAPADRCRLKHALGLGGRRHARELCRHSHWSGTAQGP